MTEYSIYLKGHRVNDLEDIRKYFQVYELLQLVNSGRLVMWLEQNDYEDYVKKFETWGITDKRKKKQKLYDIFEIPYDDATEYNITDILLEEARKDNLRIYSKYSYKVQDQKSLDSYLRAIRDYREVDDSDEPEVIVLYSGLPSGYKLPIDMSNIHYIGACDKDINMPVVWLERPQEEYEKRNITFENLYVNWRRSRKEIMEKLNYEYGEIFLPAERRAMMKEMENID